MKRLFFMICLIVLTFCACDSVAFLENITKTEAKKGPYSHVIKAYHMYEQNLDYYLIQDSKERAQRQKDFAKGFKMFSKNTFDSFYNLESCLFFEALYYAFFEIDDIGTQALLLGADGALFDVYVIQNGIAVQQEINIGEFDSPILFKNGVIRTHSYGDGEKYFYYYRFEKGLLIEQDTVLTEYLDDDNVFFRNSDNRRTGISITKEEFDRLQKEFEGDGQLAELDWKPLADYGKEE